VNIATTNLDLYKIYSDKVGPVMNPIVPTDLRAFHKTTQGFTYVDDYISAGVRPDIAKLNMSTYIFVCAKSGVYINAKKVELNPKEILGLASAHRVKYFEGREDVFDKEWQTLDVEYCERTVTVQPQHQKKMIYYIR
jgi:hypothetical protein